MILNLVKSVAFILRPFQLQFQQRDHRVDLLLKAFFIWVFLLGGLVNSGLLQLNKRVVGLSQFKPGEFMKLCIIAFVRLAVCTKE